MPYTAPSTKTAYTTLTATEWNVIVNDIIDLNIRISSGLSSAFPASPTLGLLYYTTDLNLLYQYRATVAGNAWQPIGNIMICTSSTRPTAQNGMIIYETNTNKTFRWNDVLSVWIEITNGYPIVGTSSLATLTSAFPPTVGSVAFDSTTRQNKMYVATGAGSLYLAFGNYLSGTYTQRPTSPWAGQLFYQTDTDELLKYAMDLDGQTRWMQADHDYRRDFVINGGFDVWQRGTTFNPVSATGTTGLNYGADRWQFLQATTSASAFTRQAITSADPPGFNYYLRVQRANGLTHTTPYTIQTSFESQNIQPIRGKNVTLSFWARRGTNYSSSSNQLEVKIVSGLGTDNTVSGFTSPSSVTDLPGLATSWQRYTVVTAATMPTTTTQLGVQFIFTPTGTAGAADYFDITGVQVEIGTAPTDFEIRDAGNELARCQRYYYKTGGFGAGAKSFGGGYANTTTTALVETRFPVTMRVEPSALVLAGGASNFSIRFAGSNTSCSAVPTFVTATTDSAITQATVASGLTLGDAVMLSNNGASVSTLGWSAEL